MKQMLICCFLLISLASKAYDKDSTKHFLNVFADLKHINAGSLVYDKATISKNSISVDSSVINYIRFSGNSFNSLHYYLNYDTLTSNIDFFDNGNYKKDNRYFLLDVEDCYLNTDFKISHVSQSQTVIFNNCAFKEKVRRIQIKADTVRFINCDFLNDNITLEVLPNNRVVYFELYRTDITNIRFTYTESMKLLFLRDTAYEIRKTVFEKLLSKFKIEGKDISYRNLDIQYRWWKAKGSFSAYLGALINQVWWNFGYSKGRVFIWTIFFLSIFTIFNLRKWTYISKTYPIEAISQSYAPKRTKKNNRTKNFFLVLLYTCFIFFSLSIDFKNLKVIKLRYTAIFFIQYLIGLACLIFITNAILKF